MSKARPDLGTSAWQSLRTLVFARDGRTCWLCGHDGADTIDHVIEVARGGNPLDPANCRPAHGRRHTIERDGYHCVGNYGRSSQRRAPRTRAW